MTTSADRAPVAFEQLLMLRRMATNPNPIAYHVVLELGLDGDLDTGALRWSLDELAASHHAFRARYERLGDTWTQVIDPPRPLAFTEVDLTDRPVDEVERLRAGFAREPFDIAAGGLARCLLIHVGHRSWELVVAYHHLIMDGWSRQVFLDQLAALYRAAVTPGASPPPVPARQCDDHARSGVAAVASTRARDDLRYWLDDLRGSTQKLDLPGDGPFSGLAAVQERPLRPGLRAELSAVAATSGTTLFLATAAALAVHLSHITGQHDLVLSVPFLNRATADEAVITCASSPVFLRCDVRPDEPFTRLANRVATRFADGLAHLAVPTTVLLDALVARGDWPDDQAPAAAFMTEDGRTGAVEGLPGVEATVRANRFHGVAHVELLFNLKVSAQGLALGTVYHRTRFDHATIAGWAEEFAALLDAVARDPSVPVGHLRVR